MVAKIHPSIKTKVLNEWFEGFTRNKIAENNGIGAGTVTGILQQARNNDIPDLDLMRGSCFNVKKDKVLTLFIQLVI
jgi:hypothetical protein